MNRPLNCNSFHNAWHDIAFTSYEIRQKGATWWSALIFYRSLSIGGKTGVVFKLKFCCWKAQHGNWKQIEWFEKKWSIEVKNKKSQKPFDYWDIQLVAGAGFEPTTFGLWARRATRLLHPAFIFQTVNLTDFFYSCQIFVHQLLICDVRLKAHTKPPRQD